MQLGEPHLERLSPLWDEMLLSQDYLLTVKHERVKTIPLKLLLHFGFM